ncbi:hypothetical protein ARMGADRAFT_1082812 [Armillaria gallica]|uniref:Uncharacterized protein n=1 Tax=Armillaria gallica TaxID=47427 RepID=A0A2H3DQL4_ARMGA|nr:hypothetical protein ARMGADRAFT_1082812 [Armillaria gallica]
MAIDYADSDDTPLAVSALKQCCPPLPSPTIPHRDIGTNRLRIVDLCTPAFVDAIEDPIFSAGTKWGGRTPMENDDAQIVALALGIPSATLLSIALLLAVRFRYRPLQRLEAAPATPTVVPTPTNSPANDVDAILLEQQSPRILAPIPRHPIPLDELARAGRREEKDLPEPPTPIIEERRSPTPPRRGDSLYIVTPANSPTPTTHVPRTPSPGTYSRTSARGGFFVGRDTRSLAPSTSHDPWAERNPAPAPIAPADAYQDYWDQPVQNPEWPLEPVRVTTPIADSSSTWSTAYWQNVNEQRLSPPRAVHWNTHERTPSPVAGPSHLSTVDEEGTIPESVEDESEGQRIPSPPIRVEWWETVEYEASEASDMVTEGLPAEEYLNGIHGQSPAPQSFSGSSNEPSPEPPLRLTNLDPPSDDDD